MTTKRKITEDAWLQKYWRPAMAVQYFIICMFDFMAAPIFLAIYSAIRDIPYIVWHPLTLEGGGLYHVALGAILGVAAWTRGQEKIVSIKTNNTSGDDNG